MLDAIFTAVIFLIKFALVVVCSPLIGCVGLVAEPIRFWQALTGKLRSSASRLASSAKVSVLAGIAFVFVAALGWLAFVTELYQTATCSSAGCALAGLEDFLVLCVFGSLYGLAELLLFPATFPRQPNA